MDSSFFEPPGEKEIGLNCGGFEKSGVKLQCLTGEGKPGLVLIIGRFQKLRVREIRILLYVITTLVSSSHLP